MRFQAGDAVNRFGVFRLSVETADGAPDPERLGSVGEVEACRDGEGEDGAVFAAAVAPVQPGTSAQGSALSWANSLGWFCFTVRT